MTGAVLRLSGVHVRYGAQCVLGGVDLDVYAGQAVGVVGRDGSGKTTLLRVAVGLVRPEYGDVRSRIPAAAVGGRLDVAYFAGDATLPGAARAVSWGRMGTGDDVVSDRRPLRALSRGSRQLLGLRTVLGRQRLDLVVLDEPWEGLDADGVRWLNETLEHKRDKGAALVLSSQRLADLTPICDVYVVLHRGRGTAIRAVDLAPSGRPTPARLADAVERVARGVRHR
jgi:ABC-2 type transport system ATP-binding protein